MPRSADLVGRSVALSRDIPSLFDQSLAAQHKLIGRWAAARETSTEICSRPQARRRVERIFEAAVLDVLRPVDFVDLRVTVLQGGEHGPPAIVLICDSMGQLDLGWIETSDAPIPWRAAAYKALGETLGFALPVFGYQDLFYEISLYYWEGETDDEAARQSLIEYHGADAEDLEEQTLPSTMNARRPEWMIKENAVPPAALPVRLRKTISRLNEALGALKAIPAERNAWRFESDLLYEYLPGIEECASLPPLTLVPVNPFARELDDVGRHGMEMGFMDVAGLCPLPDADHLDHWFMSLRLGAEFLACAQALIQFDPTTL